MVGGALYIRRFMMRQYLALADHSPCGHLMLALHRSMGKSGLLSPEEAEYVRKTEELDPTAVKVVFSTRPPRNAVRGVGSALWNVAVGTCLAPVVGLAMLPHQIHQRGFLVGLVPGLIMANVWAVAFAVLGYAAAAQQLVYSVMHQIACPAHYLVTMRHWDAYACRFVQPSSSGAYPGLEHELPPETLRRYAMRRAAKSKSDREKREAKYDSPNKKGGNREERSLYDVLGVPSTATDKEIKEAYTKMAMKLHPDHNPSKNAHEQFDTLTKAYRTLSNADKRAKYDAAGNDGVEDLGSKKRDGVRGLFGGDQLQKLVGDVRTGSFSMRVIDGLDYTQDELVTFQARMLSDACNTLLSYLEGASLSETAAQQAVSQQQEGSAKKTAVTTNNGKGSSTWGATTRSKVHRFINTGLSKEVLFLVGHEYLRVCDHAESTGLVGRLRLAATSVIPRRVEVRMHQAKVLLRARPSVMKDTATLIDLAWYLSASELEYTARFAAWSVLNDPTIAEDERKRRLSALRQLGAFFIASGKPYSGANKHTVDALMESLRSYQQAKSRSSDE